MEKADEKPYYKNKLSVKHVSKNRKIREENGK